MEESFIIALILLIVISIIFTAHCCSKRGSESIAMRGSLEQSRYGFAPSGSCSDPPCLYGNSFRARAADCLAAGGTSVGRSQAAMAAAKGKPNEYVPCNASLATATSAMWGIGPRATCTKFPIIMRTTGGTCRAIGGQPIGTPTDAQVAACQLGLCPIAQAQWRLTPTSMPNRGVVTIGSDSKGHCTALGGTYKRNGRCAFGVA